jgi:hypothetical protein
VEYAVPEKRLTPSIVVLTGSCVGLFPFAGQSLLVKFISSGAEKAGGDHLFRSHNRAGGPDGLVFGWTDWPTCETLPGARKDGEGG